jgi:serine/threonine protein kinase
VVLGLPYEEQIDMWSLGCIVTELITGKPLFPGIDENELLEFHVLLSGNPPQWMIDQGKKKSKFFNINNGYRIIRSKQSRLVSISKNTTSLAEILFQNTNLTKN